LKKISHNIIIKNAESDYHKLINGSLKDTSDILNNLQICLNSLLASDDEDDYAIFNNSLAEQLYTECQLIKHKIIIAIDNIDRRGDPGLESKAVKKIIPFCHHYLENHNIRIVIPIRRLTFERYPKHIGGFIYKRLTPTRIYLRPPNPISLLITKLLRSEFSSHLFRSRVFFNEGQVTLIGKQFQYLLIYLFLLLYRKDNDNDNKKNLLVSFANESAREIIRMVLNYAPFDYSDIIRKSGGRSTILDIIPDLYIKTYSSSPHADNFKIIFDNDKNSNNKQNKANKPSEFIKFLEQTITKESKFSKYILSDHHLISILMRYKHKEFTPECEGTEEDFNRLISISPELRTEYHQNLFPMPLINMFDSRFYGEKYNNFLRHIILLQCTEYDLTIDQLRERLMEIGIEKYHINSVVKLFQDKHYFIGDKFEYIEKDHDAIIKLTRKGETMLEVITWPRYINIISRATRFTHQNTLLQPDSDVSHKNIIIFVQLLVDCERHFYNSLESVEQVAFNKYLRKNKDQNRNSILPTMLSQDFFQNVITHVHAMLFNRQVSNFIKKYKEFKLGILNITKQLGYTEESISSTLP